MVENPGDAFAKIGRLVAAEATLVGFRLHKFAVLPDLEGHSHQVHLALLVNPDTIGLSEQARADQAMIEATWQATQRAERAQTLNVQDLLANLNDPDKGILG